MFKLPYELWIGARYAGLSSLRGRKGRRDRFVSFVAATSMAGIALGVAALIVVLSVMNGFQKDVRDRMLSVLPHIEIFAPGADAERTVSQAPELIAAAKKFDCTVLIDAAQAVPHLDIDVSNLGCDLLVFSGHKVYAPTGIGVLWGRRDVLEKLPPYRGGGEMIKEVSFEHTTYNDIPFKYEAGTPNIEGAIALAAALDYVDGIGKSIIQEHETSLIRAAEQELLTIDGIRLFGPTDRCGALSFAVENVHAYDLGTFLDQMGVAVRTGHHCCQPLMARFGISGTTRASFALYNTLDEVKAFGEATRRAVRMLR